SEGVTRWPSINTRVRFGPKLRRLRMVRFWYAWRGNEEPENTGILIKASETDVGVICSRSLLVRVVRGVGELAIFEMTREPVTITVSVPGVAFCAQTGELDKPASKAITETLDLEFASMFVPY